MSLRFKNKSDIFNIVVTAVAALLSVGIMLYGVWHFGIRNTWPELVLNLWAICLVDMLIAVLYNIDIMLEPVDEFTSYMMVEIWIRPTITYGLVACFIKEKYDNQ